MILTEIKIRILSKTIQYKNNLSNLSKIFNEQGKDEIKIKISYYTGDGNQIV